MLLALPEILKEYPDTKVCVAGNCILRNKNLIGKLKISVANLNNKLEKAYAQLGKIQFKSLKDVNVENAEVSAAVLEIKRIRDEMKKLLQEIDAVEGKITCPKCGSKVPAKSAFCNKCGERL